MFCADLATGPPASVEGIGVETAEGGTGGPAGGEQTGSSSLVGDATLPSPTSVFIGEGLPVVPGRLAERIRKWAFVEMHELLPELLTNHNAEEGRERSRARAGRKRTLDINAWLQCFGVFVSVVAKESPEAVPELMAYMGTMIRASQEYEGAAWATYDVGFRRQAAATGQRDWSRVNSSLYAICFTGRARRGQRCELCLSAAHRTAECSTLEEDPDLARRVRAMEAAWGGVPTPQFVPPPRGARASPSNEVCRLYNSQKGCYFRSCEFRHACRLCGGSHPASECKTA